MPTPHKKSFVLHPAHQRPFSADARYLQTNKPKPVVVFVHGFKGFKDWGHFNLLADFFAREGYVFVKLNLSHNGTTPTSADLVDMEAFGNNNFSIELDDIDTLLNHLHRADSPVPAPEMDLRRLALIGHSRGGATVLLKAAEDPRVRAVVTWAAVSDLNQRWSEADMAQWRKEGVRWIENARIGRKMPLYFQLVEDYRSHKSRLDLPALLPHIKQPLLVLHGDQDETVPLVMAEQLEAQHNQAELEVLPGCSHTFGGRHPYPDPELPADAQKAARLSMDFLQRIFKHG